MISRLSSTCTRVSQILYHLMWSWVHPGRIGYSRLFVNSNPQSLICNIGIWGESRLFSPLHDCINLPQSLISCLFIRKTVYMIKNLIGYPRKRIRFWTTSLSKIFVAIFVSGQTWLVFIPIRSKIYFIVYNYVISYNYE